MNPIVSPPAIQHFTENGLSFEIYPDGDCVVFSQATGFMQIKAETIAKLAKGSKLAAQSIRGESVMLPTTNAPVVPAPAARPEPKTVIRDAFVEPVEPKTSFVPVRDQYRRRVRWVGTAESGAWECVFVDDEKEVARHIYVRRDQARDSEIETAIGHRGSEREQEV